jgi:hypothetical protein
MDQKTIKFPKYLERRLSESGILVFREKHGNRYFICNTKEDYCRAAIKIIKERLDEGWYWDEEDDDDNQAAAEYAGVKRRKRYVRKDETTARQIVESNDLVRAYMFLEERSDYEYEGMYIEYPEDF